MRVPVITGVIARRILVNYRVRPETLRRLLPAPFEPKQVKGWGMAGICLLRLDQLRPIGVPAYLGVSSENAAHRIAVEWEERGSRCEGVFVRRRDTSSWLNAFVGGQLFPGVHHRAEFDVADGPDLLRVALRSRDGVTSVAVGGRPASTLPSSSVFGSLSEASTFFELGSRGYSPGAREGSLDGLELRTSHWKVMPFEVSELNSSFFESQVAFPRGSAEFDHALLMRDIPHEWRALDRIEAR
jgi:hypothetical protein